MVQASGREDEEFRRRREVVLRQVSASPLVLKFGSGLGEVLTDEVLAGEKLSKANRRLETAKNEAMASMELMKTKQDSASRERVADAKIIVEKETSALREKADATRRAVDALFAKTPEAGEAADILRQDDTRYAYLQSLVTEKVSASPRRATDEKRYRGKILKKLKRRLSQGASDPNEVFERFAEEVFSGDVETRAKATCDEAFQWLYRTKHKELGVGAWSRVLRAATRCSDCFSPTKRSELEARAAHFERLEKWKKLEKSRNEERAAENETNDSRPNRDGESGANSSVIVEHLHKIDVAHTEANVYEDRVETEAEEQQRAVAESVLPTDDDDDDDFQQSPPGFHFEYHAPPPSIERSLYESRSFYDSFVLERGYHSRASELDANAIPFTSSFSSSTDASPATRSIKTLSSSSVHSHLDSGFKSDEMPPGLLVLSSSEEEPLAVPQFKQKEAKVGTSKKKKKGSERKKQTTTARQDDDGPHAMPPGTISCRQMLLELNLESLIGVFEREEINDVKTCRCLSDGDLTAIGVKLGPRAKIREWMNSPWSARGCERRDGVVSPVAQISFEPQPSTKDIKVFFDNSPDWYKRVCLQCGRKRHPGLCRPAHPASREGRRAFAARKSKEESESVEES